VEFYGEQISQLMSLRALLIIQNLQILQVIALLMELKLILQTLKILLLTKFSQLFISLCENDIVNKKF